jgi:hypothetical protein
VVVTVSALPGNMGEIGIDMVPKYYTQGNGMSQFLIPGPGIILSKSEPAVVPNNTLTKLFGVYPQHT